MPQTDRASTSGSDKTEKFGTAQREAPPRVCRSGKARTRSTRSASCQSPLQSDPRLHRVDVALHAVEFRLYRAWKSPMAFMRWRPWSTRGRGYAAARGLRPLACGKWISRSAQAASSGSSERR